MATMTLRPQQATGWRAQLDRPIVAFAVALVYIICAILLATLPERSSTWYPLLNMIAVPVFLLAPLVVVSLNLPRIPKILLLIVMLVVIMPLVGMKNTPLLEIAIQVSIFSGLALGLNVVVGFAGLLDLGYVAFFAVGAYLWAVFSSPADTIFAVNGITLPGWAFFFVTIAAVFVTAGVGILLGLPVLRLRGDYLAIVTLGFGEAIRLLARNLDSPINITNGPHGLLGIGSPPLPGFAISFTASISSALGIRLDNPEAISKQLMFYALGVVILLIIILVCSRLKNSPIGRAWNAIREDEVAAIAMGVPLVRMKLLAFASGAAFAGAIGALYASKQTYIDPNSFLLLQSISILAMVIVGGMGNIKGVILGAMIITIINLSMLSNLSQFFNNLRNQGILSIPSELEPAKYQPLVYGLILVLMMLFRPAGLLPEKSRKLELQAEKDDPLEFPTEEPLEDAVLVDTSTPGGS